GGRYPLARDSGATCDPLRYPRAHTSRAREPHSRRPSLPPVQRAADAASNRVALVERGERQNRATPSATLALTLPARASRTAADQACRRCSEPPMLRATG